MRGIYLIVNFEWPKDVTKEMAENAMKLHKLTKNGEWIRETVAASGGIGGELSSVWIWWLESYASLDTLLRDSENEIHNAYINFFSQMKDMREMIKEQVWIKDD